jgi:uncharacterized protein (DUF488 family)
LDEFVAMLAAHGIERLVDIRTIPRSRRNPQFNRETLAGELARRGIEYVHLKDLGGLRRPRPDSPNTAWKNASFRGYADYMMSGEFAAALDQLIQLSQQKRVAMMCAEAVPWRCHRSLVADALTAADHEVAHIMSSHQPRPHTVTKTAVLLGRRVLYPAGVTFSRVCSNPKARRLSDAPYSS